MFEWFRLRNFLTHTDTRVELGPLTLLLGGNNSGKTNFLRGVRLFAELAHRGTPEALGGDDREALLRADDLFPYRHRLAHESAPMALSCRWRDDDGVVEYEVELFPAPELDGGVGCRERVEITPVTGEPTVETSGTHDPSGYLCLQTALGPVRTDEEQTLLPLFFSDLAGIRSYDLQPSALRERLGEDADIPTAAGESRRYPLGAEGEGLHTALSAMRMIGTGMFDRVVARMQRFEPTFRSVSFNGGTSEARWLFDVGHPGGRLEEFAPDAVSDGLLRAAAVAVLASTQFPPALMMLEEIENGVSQSNLSNLIGWLRQAAGPGGTAGRGYNTQFILTSHSVGVLREFAGHLEDVYHFRLQRQGYRSAVVRMSEALRTLADLGTVDGEPVTGRDGIESIAITPARLTELWFSGTIGGA